MGIQVVVTSLLLSGVESKEWFITAYTISFSKDDKTWTGYSMYGNDSSPMVIVNTY